MRIILPLCLLALVAAVYANSLHGQFIFDDSVLIQHDELIMNVKSLGDVGHLATIGGWRQLLRVTYALNYYYGGLSTFGYHLVNVALHAMNVLLVYGILLAITGRYAAFGGAAAFAVHALMSSAVNYVSGRSSLLCATFYFAAILLFFAGMNSRRKLLLGLAAAVGLLAWSVKQEAIVLPLFLGGTLLLGAEKRARRSVMALAVVPMIALIVMRNDIKTLYATTTSNSILVSAGYGNVLPPATYLRTYLSATVGYFFPRLLYPDNLSIDPETIPVTHWYNSEFLISINLLTLLAWLGARFYKREPLFGFAVLAILVSPLVAYAAIPLADVILEHRAYIPGLGIACFFAWIFDWVGRNHRTFLLPAFTVVLAIFGSMTISRNTVFATNVSAWEDAVTKAPAKPRPHFNLGQAYQDAQRIPDAIREYERSLKLKPDLAAAYSNLGAIYLEQQRLHEAEEMLLKGTSLAPNFGAGFVNLGVAYIRKQNPERALAALDHALEIDRWDASAHFNKGEALALKGDYRRAAESYRLALEAGPGMVDLKVSVGVGYLRLGMFEEAIEDYEEILAKQPAYGPAVLNLAAAYWGRGDRRIAKRILEEFIDRSSDPGSPYVFQARRQLESLAESPQSPQAAQVPIPRSAGPE